jgi:hypothetical protein
METTAPAIRALELKEQQHRADVAELIVAARHAAEYLEAIVEGEAEDSCCDWPDVDGETWCCAGCKNYGCAKSRSYAIRALIAKHGA